LPQTTGKRVVRCEIAAASVSNIEKLAGAEVLAFIENPHPWRPRRSGNTRPTLHAIVEIFAVSNETAELGEA
jgi:hypothetical protein